MKDKCPICGSKYVGLDQYGFKKYRCGTVEDKGDVLVSGNNRSSVDSLTRNLIATLIFLGMLLIATIVDVLALTFLSTFHGIFITVVSVVILLITSRKLDKWIKQ